MLDGAARVNDMVDAAAADDVDHAAPQRAAHSREPTLTVVRSL